MKAAVMNTRVDRHTGKILSSEIEDFQEMSEDEFYRPLVEILYRSYQANNKSCLEPSLSLE